jgi:dihydroorotase/N-acyl-D-amino-acid deacylase
MQRGMIRTTTILLAMAAAAPGCDGLRGEDAGGYDLVITNGRIVDGTGAPWFRGDVGIRGDRIAAIGRLDGAEARRRIDARGAVVAPGFIDLLGQSEMLLLVDGRAESKVRQGVTTEITGEGGSVAPVVAEDVHDMKPWLDRYHLTVDWTDLDGYFERLEAARPAINLGTFVGAAQVRRAVLGAADVVPDAAQLARMEEEVERAMRQGAFGVSSSLIYAPGAYAKTAELVALARVAARHGGIYATHIRDESDGIAGALEEAFSIGREAAVPVEIWHLKCSGRKNWGRMPEVVAAIERARASGVEVSANVYPYIASSNALDSSIPTWAHEGGVDAMLARFRDPAQRERILREIRDGEDGAGGWKTRSPEDIMITDAVSPSVARWRGKRLSEVAAGLSLSAEEAMVRLVEEDKASVMVVRFAMNEDDLQVALRRSWVSFGADSGAMALDGPLARDRPHPRAFGTMPRILGHYARDLGLFPVEEVVRRMTSQAARRVGLLDRGILRPGMMADVVVFDPARVRDLATFEEPTRYSEGIDHVVVNGRVVLEAGRMTGERPGRPLRHRNP